MTSYATRLREPRILIVLTLLLAAIVLAVVVAVRALRAPEATTPGIVPGYLVNAIPGHVEDADRHGTVTLPSGDLVFSVARPTQKQDSVMVPPPAGEESTDETNAGENRIVHIGWQLGSGTSPVSLDTVTYQFHVTLVSDGHRYALPASSWSDDDPDFPYTSVVNEAAWYVVVAGKAKHLQVEVSYDGQVQTLDLDTGKVDRGRAAYLYSARPAPTAYPCRLLTGRQRREYTSNGMTCQINVSRPVPFYPGLGWTDSPDQGWTVVTFKAEAFSLKSYDHGQERYFDATPGDPRLTLDGRSPDLVIAPYTGFGTASGAYVFRSSMSPTSLSVRAPFVATGEDGDEAFRFGLDKKIRLR